MGVGHDDAVPEDPSPREQERGCLIDSLSPDAIDGVTQRLRARPQSLADEVLEGVEEEWRLVAQAVGDARALVAGERTDGLEEGT